MLGALRSVVRARGAEFYRRLSTMRAVVVEEHGGRDKIKLVQDASKPEIAPGHVLVRNEVAGVNFIDTYHRSGLYAVQLPFTLGVEGVGEVVESRGDDTKLKGRRVGYFGGATYAEYTAVPTSALFEVPTDIDAATAIVLTTQGMTAHYLATSCFPISKGDYVVVHAGAGGTGQLLVQIAKVLGAHVIATCSEKKTQFAQALGADLVLPYDTMSHEDIIEKVKDFSGQGAHIVYDGVGARTHMLSLDMLRPRGKCAFFGNASGAVPPIDPLLLSAKGSLYITRPKLHDFVVEEGELEGRMKDLFTWVRSGQLKVNVQRRYPLQDAAAAHELLENGGTTGKLVLDIN